MHDDIVAAVATAWGEAAIAIVRLSGEGCTTLVDGCFKGARPLCDEPPRRMALGKIVEGETTLDRVLAVRFERGASYTGEESVEVHCHGGAAAAQRCLELFLSCGARMAQPGEFTRRAFTSGRLDLAQAEAVLGVIRARSDEALASSERSLQGDLSRRVRALADQLTALRAELEVRIDYPEEIEEDEAADLKLGVARIAEELTKLIDRCRVGAMLDSGLRVAIVGRPNVGKSSLLNALCGSERAIVTEHPGTTRDTVEARLVHRGMPICFVDTAGIRAADGEVERMGIERARSAAADADLCVLVLDASAGVLEGDREAAEAVREKKTILVLNKSDLPNGMNGIESLEHIEMKLHISALTGEGVETLKDAIFDTVVRGVPLAEGFAATARITEALSSALSVAEEAVLALTSGDGVDVAGSLLAEASEHLVSILGADATEELLDKIFSTFCVGK